MSDPIEEGGSIAEGPDTTQAIDRPLNVLPPIAGFWRRVGAIAIDGLMLGVAGQALAWTMSSFWFGIGPYGRFVGLLIALLYFGLMNSHVGGGQTVGKRAMGIAVRDRGNQRIAIGRSMVRTLIWLIPVTLNGWSLPIFSSPVIAWFSSVMVFGVGGAVLFTMVFNRRTRQGLHDMMCGTFVVHLDDRQRIAAFPTVARSQWIASGIFLALGLLLPAIGGMVASRYAERITRVTRLHEALEHDPRFFSVSVLDQTFTGGSGSTRTLQIQAWYKGNPPESLREEVRNEIATRALAMVEDIERYDQMRISVTSGYDLGIATGRLTKNDNHTIQQWRETLAARTPGSISTH